LAPGLIPLGLIPLFLIDAPARAQQPIALSPEQAAAVDRTMRTKPDPAGCSQQGDAIVVCGRRFGGGGRPMAFEREPGEIVRHVNEPGTGMAALAADHCTRLCDVGVSVDLISAARAVPKIARHILGRD
jgi:hypothetical protein